MNDPKALHDEAMQAQLDEMTEFLKKAGASNLVDEEVEIMATEPVAPDALQQELDEVKDQLLRAIAETENVRKLAVRDRKDAETYASTKFARDMLSVYDNLTRALAAANAEVRATAPDLFAGIELTQKELLASFAKHKIHAVVPENGSKFDAHQHQAMFEAPSSEYEPGTIVQVMQNGFVIGDRLLRPAMVGVAKAVEA